MRRLAPLLLLLSCLPGRTPAQPPAIRISGQVRDSVSGRPLEFVNVFLAQTTIGTVTRADGRFQLDHVPPGPYELIFSRLGYALVRRHLELTSAGRYTVDVRLSSRPITVGEVEATGSRREWKEHLGQFERIFLGESRNAEGCKLENPEVLSFKADSSTGVLLATADRPLLVENRALGYHLFVVLSEFRWNLRGDYGSFLIFPRFQPLTSSATDQAARWSENRAVTYAESPRHFLAALVHRKLDEEGFHLFAGSLEDLQQRLGKTVPPDSLTLRPVPGTPFTRWQWNGWLRVDQDLPVGTHTSFLYLERAEVYVDSAGTLRDPLSVGVLGFWQGYRLADLLPSDYHPPKLEQ
ncbi:MAG TPA: carboxypeptidase-like regulatory domain-containing protein [Bacteroidota bacterium]